MEFSLTLSCYCSSPFCLICHAPSLRCPDPVILSHWETLLIICFMLGPGPQTKWKAVLTLGDSVCRKAACMGAIVYVQPVPKERGWVWWHSKLSPP